MTNIENKTDRCMYRQWFYDYESFGKALKIARVTKDLTQDDIANECRIARSTYWKMEKGGYCNPELMARVSEFLGVNFMAYNIPPSCDSSQL